jgi:hypothetical protein
VDPFEGLGGDVAEIPDVLGAEIGQFGLLPIPPQILDGVEFGGVGGEAFDVELGLFPLHIGLHQPAVVDGRPIPQQQDLAGYLAVEGFEEGDDLRAFDRAGVEPEVEVAPGQAGDRRKTIPVEVEGQHRGLAAGRPRPDPLRFLAQPAFVEEDERPPLPAGFFLRRGQVLVFHSAMADSLRSRARPTGRCGLNPSWPSSRQTCTVLNRWP